MVKREQRRWTERRQSWSSIVSAVAAERERRRWLERRRNRSNVSATATAAIDFE
jgi:hypothetical protein